MGKMVTALSIYNHTVTDDARAAYRQWVTLQP